MSDAIQALREFVSAYRDRFDVPERGVCGPIDEEYCAALNALAAYAQRAAPPERDERAAFEAWCAANGHGTIDDMMMPLDRSLRALLWSVWQARASASPEHSTAPALAEVTLADPSNITAHIRWLLNPLPIGSLLYEAPAPEHSAEPVAWMTTRLRRKDDEESGRVRYLHFTEQAAREDFDGWAELEGAKPTIAPLYTAPPKDQP